jgi:periplasmic mercuric ion binding protein
MKNSLHSISAALVFIAASSTSAWAAEQSVTLSMPTMDCEVCPITVKKALGKVVGVSRTDVSVPKREVTVTFDDAKTNVSALTAATKNAGYPSTPVK